MSEQKNNPLHGLTLQVIVETLVDMLGWEEMGQAVKIKCFTHDPSIKSSLKFLRKTPWAREKVEQLYLSTVNPSASTSKKQPAQKSAEPFVWPDISAKENTKK